MRRTKQRRARTQVTRTLLVTIPNLRLDVEQQLRLLLLEERDLFAVDVELLLQLRRHFLDEALGIGRSSDRGTQTRRHCLLHSRNSAQPKLDRAHLLLLNQRTRDALEDWRR